MFNLQGLIERFYLKFFDKKKFPTNNSGQNVLLQNSNPQFSYPQTLFPQPQQVVISIQQPSPYPMTFPQNAYMQHLPVPNCQRQPMPVLQSDPTNQSVPNDDSDFMARLVKKVSEQLKKE